MDGKEPMVEGEQKKAESQEEVSAEERSEEQTAKAEEVSQQNESEENIQEEKVEAEKPDAESDQGQDAPATEDQDTSSDDDDDDDDDDMMSELDENDPEQMLEAYDETLRDFEEGEIVKGVVVKIDRDEVMVDVGYKSEGYIPLSELAQWPMVPRR